MIENRGGAAGILGGQACAQSPGDGYTLCVIYHSTMSYNPVQFDKLPYNADTDFVPITRLFFLTEGLFVNADLPAKTVAELRALAQGKPDGLNFATLGNGSFPDLFRVWLNNQWGTKIVGVPYKGGGPAAQALAAGEVQMTRFGVGNFRGLMDAGKVRTLAITSEQRSQACCRRCRPSRKPASIIRVRAGGGSRRRRARRSRSWTRSMRRSRRCSATRNSSPFWSSNRWYRRSPARPAFAEFLKADRKAAEALVKVANTPRTEYKPQ